MTTYQTPDGLKWPSVTTIIGDVSPKEGLVQWAANTAVDHAKKAMEKSKVRGYVKWFIVEAMLAEAKYKFRDLSEEAKSIGSEVHAAIEHHLKTDEEPRIAREEAIAAYVAFLEWRDSVDLRVIATERTVYGDYYAGTLDLECALNGQHTILDFKASKGIYPEYRYQIAAYRKTVPEATACGILRLDKETGLPEYKDTSRTYERDYIVFDKMKELYYAKHPRIRKGAGYEG